VDRNLDDDWLRRLNQLQYLNLRSICEGHPGVAPGWSQKPYAAIKLSLKDGISLLEHSLALLQDTYNPSPQIGARSRQGFLRVRAVQDGRRAGRLQLAAR
jgi:hypothetical protein